MATYVTNRDSGGLTDEKGHLKFLANSYTGNILDGMQVVESSPTGMSVRVAAGNIRIPYSNYAYMGWSEGYTGVSVATADPSNPRIDRVVAYVDRSMTFTDSDTNNPNSLKFKAVTGTPNAVPSKPSDGAVNTSVGASNPWVEIGLITVPAAASTIVNANITDTRVYIAPTFDTDWKKINTGITSVTYNGAKSYTIGVDTDLTSVLSRGMRLRSERANPAPMMSTLLNGTTQYYSKSSPANMAFTDDFAVSAYIYVTGYPSSTASIVSKLDASNNGWAFALDVYGNLRLYGYAGSGNWSYVVSGQSIPINKWVHVVAQLDMSTFTATPTTSYVMIDGADVGATVGRAGTNPTALISGGNLEIGSQAGGSQKFPGAIAQVAVFNAKVSQSTMLTYMSQGLTGTETSLVSAYSFDNSINDLNTSNANNLTATGSAVATNASSPFGKQANNTNNPYIDFGIITDVTSSTLTVQTPEGCTLSTVSNGINSLMYSSVKSPRGFPMNKSRWSLDLIIYSNGINTATSGTTTSTIYNPGGLRILLPIGNWDIVQNLFVAITPSSQNINILSGLAVTPTGGADLDLVEHYMLQIATTSNLNYVNNYRSKNLDVPTATTRYLILMSTTAFSALAYSGGPSYNTISRLNAYNTYL